MALLYDKIITQQQKFRSRERVVIQFLRDECLPFGAGKIGKKTSWMMRQKRVPASERTDLFR